MINIKFSTFFLRQLYKMIFKWLNHSVGILSNEIENNDISPKQKEKRVIL